jgi:hypothetical protein
MLSRPFCPFGQPTPLSVPHVALRMPGTGRVIEPALAAVIGKPHTRTRAAEKKTPNRRRINAPCIDVEQPRLELLG